MPELEHCEQLVRLQFEPDIAFVADGAETSPSFLARAIPFHTDLLDGVGSKKLNELISAWGRNLHGKDPRAVAQSTLTRPADASKLKKHITLVADRLHKVRLRCLIEALHFT